MTKYSDLSHVVE